MQVDNGAKRWKWRLNRSIDDIDCKSWVRIVIRTNLWLVLFIIYFFIHSEKLHPRQKWIQCCSIPPPRERCNRISLSLNIFHNRVHRMVNKNSSDIPVSYERAKGEGTFDWSSNTEFIWFWKVYEMEDDEKLCNIV